MGCCCAPFTPPQVNYAPVDPTYNGGAAVNPQPPIAAQYSPPQLLNPFVSPDPAPTPAPVTVSPVQPVPVTPQHEGVSSVDEALAQLRQKSGGLALAGLARDYGVGIITSSESGFLDYTRPNVRVNPSALSFPFIVGALAHELGHSVSDRFVGRGQLFSLPRNLGGPAEEIAAELVASAVAVNDGFPRGESAVTTSDGTLRSARGAVDNILSTSYVQYYKVPIAEVTEADRQQMASLALAQATRILGRIGVPVPSQYAAQ